MGLEATTACIGHQARESPFFERAIIPLHLAHPPPVPCRDPARCWCDCRREHQHGVGARCRAVPGTARPRNLLPDACRRLHPGRVQGHRARLLRRLLLARARGARLARGRASAACRRQRRQSRRRAPECSRPTSRCGRSSTATARPPIQRSTPTTRRRPTLRRRVEVRRRRHRIDLRDRRHRAGWHRRARSADRRAERPLRPHADALQPHRLRLHRQQPLSSCATRCRRCRGRGRNVR